MSTLRLTSGRASVVRQQPGVELEGAGQPQSVVIDNPNHTVRGVDELRRRGVLLRQLQRPAHALPAVRSAKAVQGELPQRHSDGDVSGIVVSA